ncbi:MAG: CPBP family glutamic-type intramembrane protease [Chloroflexota bacterium]
MLASPSTGDAAPQPRTYARFPWRVFGVLLLAACLGSLALLPYLATLLQPALGSLGRPLGPVLAVSLIQPVIVAALASAVGLRLGDSVGLGAPLLRDWLEGAPTARRVRALLVPSIGAGLLIADAVLLLEFAVFAPNLSPAVRGAHTPAPPAWQGVLASLYGAMNEEIMLRLGRMTLFVWIGARLTRRFPPRAGMFWTANLLAAVLFGLGHLPAAAALGPLTPLTIARVLTLNSLAGVVYGWLYWRRGLLAAMVAHLATNLAIHAVAPALLAPA